VSDPISDKRRPMLIPGVSYLSNYDTQLITVLLSTKTTTRRHSHNEIFFKLVAFADGLTGYFIDNCSMINCITPVG
jgi:hypothetical protein